MNYPWILHSRIQPNQTWIKNIPEACDWWLTPVILATWEADIGRIVAQGQLGKKTSLCDTPPLSSPRRNK
jgi:hypothetical protein